LSLLTLGLYLSIAPTRLTSANYGEDGGDFLSAMLTGGIPHPTGYPTYTILGSLFQHIPINTPVFRGVLISLVPAALGVGLLTLWMGYLLGDISVPHTIAASVTGVAWGVSPLLFSQAVIVEVHGLQSLIVVLVLWWIALNLVPGINSNRGKILILTFLVGLGFSNHLTIVLFVPAVILTLLIAIKHKVTSWKFILTEISVMLSGLLVYLYLPLRAQSYPPINWGNPQTISGFLWDITGNPYRSLLFNEIGRAHV
jgi:hypothetical protein